MDEILRFLSNDKKKQIIYVKCARHNNTRDKASNYKYIHTEYTFESERNEVHR